MSASPAATPDLDQRLSLALGLAYRNGYDLPAAAVHERAARFLALLPARLHAAAELAGVAIDPNGAIEVVLPLGRRLVTAWFDDVPLVEVVTEMLDSPEMPSERHMSAEELLDQLAAWSR